MEDGSSRTDEAIILYSLNNLVCGRHYPITKMSELADPNRNCSSSKWASFPVVDSITFKQCVCFMMIDFDTYDREAMKVRVAYKLCGAHCLSHVLAYHNEHPFTRFFLSSTRVNGSEHI